MRRKKKAHWLLFSMIMVIFASGCSKAGETTKEVGSEIETPEVDAKEEVDEETILSVGDFAYRLEDMMYYIYIEEEAGWMYNDIYTSFYGEDYNYWEEIEKEAGMTGEETAKEAVILSAKKDLVWYQEALKRGMTLDDEDKKAASDAYQSFCEELTDTQKNMSGMGEELLAYFEKQQVIEKYKESLLEEAEFDEEAVSKEVSAKENREYVFEYLEIYKEDESGELYSDEEMKKYVKILEDLAGKIDKKTDMESIIPEKYQDYILHSDDSLVESDDDYYGKYNKVDIDKELKKLKNGEVSQVFETEYSYFVARMKDNNSKEYYEGVVMETIDAAKNEIYDTAYDNAVEGYSITLNEENWKDVTLGNLIYGF